jgi:hypothetical protein
MNRILNVTFGLLLFASLSLPHVHAASVGEGGYTNSFTTQPPAGDWSSGTIGSGAGAYPAASMDADVNALNAASVAASTVMVAQNPPDLNSSSTWSTSGYLQTRPTTVGGTLLMCTLVNTLGTEAIGVTIGYDLAKLIPVTEEIDGHRAFYSLSGSPGSWVNIGPFSTGTAGRPTVTLNITWPNNTPLYIIWADDNAAASPDTAFQIDNFSAVAIPGTQIPVAITSQPQNQNVPELAPASFSVGLSGYLPPTVQWYTNDVAIPDATNTTYSIASAPLHYNGLNFKVIAQNVTSNVTYYATSTVATLTVNADNVAPTLVGVVSAGGGIVTVTFSEPITPATATNLANYVITNLSGTLIITNATLAGDMTNVTLFTQPQIIGNVYTLTVNGVRDISAAGNLIPANSQATFTAFDFATANIGSPGLAGSLTILSSTAFDVSGSGSAIGGPADQFTMAYQQKAGDFDVKTRVASFGFTDPWAKAALMARATLESNSVFAAVSATPLAVGCVFESRTTIGANATATGNFPANFPNMWLRLRRVGNVFTGFASADGSNWVQLGSATLSVGSVYLGFAVTSHDTTKTTTAQFRDYMTTGTANTIALSSLNFTTEPLNAAARTGPMVISEIMYKPGGTNSILEFVELYNSNPYYEDISGYRLSGAIDYTFPSNTIVPGGGFVVVAFFPPAMEAAYGISGVLGPYTNRLPASGTLRLRSDTGAILLTVDYSGSNPWPVGTDGTGHSIVLTRASYGQNDPRSWDASDRIGGSPGKHEAMRTRTGLRAVVINEILAHTDLPLLDYIELYNYSAQPVDISGCYLSDRATTNFFQVPINTVLPPHGYISFDQNQLGFALDHAGEKIFLRSADGSQMLDSIQFEPQENGVAFGRYPDGSPEFYRLRARTPGDTNALPLVNDIVINEIMYGPISEEQDDKYVELYNKGASPVNIGGWRFTSGIDYKFPPNTIIPADGYVVVAKNLSHLLLHYGNLSPANAFGDFDGNLSRDGERVALGKPELDVTTNGSGQLVTNTLYIPVDEVRYGTGGRWGKWANQGGSSLELIDPRSNHRLAYNWGDSDETAKAPWTKFEHSGTLDTGNTQGGTPIDRLEINMLGEGECLLDDIEAGYGNGTTNLLANGTFESGIGPWTPQGNHIASSLELTGRTGTRSLHVRSDGNADSGANRIRSSITALNAGQIFTIRGYVRWLRGWPEVSIRTKGGFLEAYGRMELPPNLGTPGARNSRAQTNAAPAIYSVSHNPVLPQAGENVVITAGAQDPDGVTNVVLFWRLDTSSTFSSQLMNDNGVSGDAVAGDGIYSATIVAQTPGTMIAFYVEAADALRWTNQFPVNAIVAGVDGQRRECMLRWGDPIPVAAFSTYRLWMSTANVNAYVNRPALSNYDVDGTMIVNNNRPIYNVGSHYSNSPYHQGQNGSPVTGSTHFVINLPLDDKYLGENNFNKVHAPGNGGFGDPSLMREQIAYYLTRKLGMPYLHRRFVAMYVNGTRKGGADRLQEDTQRPGGELINEFFPDETEGRLFKIQPWFEFDDVTVTGGGSAAFDNEMWCTMTRNLSTNAHKIARYRQNWLTRSADKTALDYTNVIALTEAASLPTSHPAYWQNLGGLIDVDHWARIFAIEHAVGNWDSFGGVNAQNMYGYKPTQGKWKLMIWDYNIVLNNPNTGDTQSNPPGGNLFDVQSGQDPNMAAMEATPLFRRAWWRAYKEIVSGPMRPDVYYPAIDGRYNAMLASGVNVAPGPVTAIKTFIDTARVSISNQMAAVDVNGFTVSTPSVTASASNLVTITGTATFDITSIEINGVSRPITWTGITAWSVLIPVTNNAPVSVVAYNKNHTRIGATNTVSVNYTAPTVPDPRGFVVFNEIMYSSGPNNPGTEYIELFNTHTNLAFNIGGWRVNGVDYTFPAGAYIGPRQFLLLVKNRVSFSVAYGASIAVFDQFPGSLQGDGETLSLIKPAATTNEIELVIDKVRYENKAPWSTNASDSGSSLQLIDPNQDNHRVGNWASTFTPATFTPAISTPEQPRDGWRFFSASGSIGSGDGNGTMRLLIYLDTPGSAIIDDLAIVAGTNAAVGPNFVANGDFESPLTQGLTNSWRLGTQAYGDSTIVNDLVHSGAGAFKIIGTNAAGAANPPSYSRSIFQWLSPAPAVNSTNTLSFWYWATNSAQNLLVRVRNSAALTTGSTGTNINIFITPSNYVPAMQVSSATNSVSPGSNNLLSIALPAFPSLWINELQADNVTGILDSYGQREPWVEIYNTSTNAVSLEGLYLTHTYTNYTNWAFPAGSSIGPTQFLVVFCDGQPLQTSNTEYHTSFRLPSASGSVALSRLFTNAPQVMDYVNYAGLHSDRSYGSLPDGQPFDRQEFFYVTPRGANDGRSAPLVVFINEWMAGNTSALADPADGNFEDWFELYNPATNAVDIAGYYLTDSLTNAAGVVSNKLQFLITTNMAHIIPPQGYLLVWADNETGQNVSGGVIRPDMHVSFALSLGGEAIGLFAADGTQIDRVTFGQQTNNVSQGRFPDGDPGIYFMPSSVSPRAANYLPGASNAAPVLTPIGNKSIYIGQTLAFTATATDSDLPAQTLTFSLDPTPPAGASISGAGAFTFTPTGVGNSTITIRVTDSGVPAKSDFESILVEVLPALDFTSSVRNGNNLELTWGTRAGKSYAVDYKDDLNAVEWTPLWTNTAVGNSLSFTNVTTSPAQGFFRIRTVE